MLTSFLRSLLFILPILISACSASETGSPPSDFSFVMDVRTSERGSANHIHITIDSKGHGQFEIYDSKGVIQYDKNDSVIYNKDQLLKEGKFNLTSDEQARLWTAIQQNQFFDMIEDYRMAIGHSYTFIVIEADGKKHTVDNIGMEVPEVRALVEATDAIVPEELDLEYGEGYVP